MPSRISASQEIAYLKALAETGNATLAASRAQVSCDWAYKRRGKDARFDGLSREMVAIAGQRLKAESAPLPNPSPAKGGGAMQAELVPQLGLGKRVQVRRARARQWTGAREQRFLDALAATHDVEVAAASAGIAAPSAYRHRARWPGFARHWEEALATCGPHEKVEWIEGARCFLSGEPQPPDWPVRVTSVTQVLRLMEKSWGMERESE